MDIYIIYKTIVQINGCFPFTINDYIYEISTYSQQ